MKEKKENNQLNFKDSHYQEKPKRKVSNSLGDLDVSHLSERVHI